MRPTRSARAIFLQISSKLDSPSQGPTVALGSLELDAERVLRMYVLDPGGENES